jgi:hypothetical protein
MIGGWALAHVTPQALMFASGSACVLAGVAGYTATARGLHGLTARQSVRRELVRSLVVFTRLREHAVHAQRGVVPTDHADVD